MASQLESRRLCAQFALLTALGAAVCAGLTLGSPPTVRADGGFECPVEGPCTFKKPNLLFVLEYSTAMNQPSEGDPRQTRWQAAVAAITAVTAPGGFVSQNTHVALLRFGHDPDPNSPGTTIPGDMSNLVDGVALDLAWDDEAHVFQECAGQQLIDVLAATPPPLAGMPMGIGAWLEGALERAAVEIAQTEADHPEDEGERRARIVVVGSGAWTSADGQTVLGPPSDDPIPTAIALFNDGVELSVFEVTDKAEAEAAADALALAGGSAGALDAVFDLEWEIQMGVQAIIDDVAIEEQCPEGLMRVMIVLDASSSMLNVNGGLMYGAMGETPWDQVREAFRGTNNDFNFFRILTDWGKLAEFIQVGLIVFGDEGPDGPRLLMQYNHCMEDALEWALEPQTACVQPGCDDPWGGPPIEWTFTDSTIDLPDYPTTYNHMPACQGSDACAGSDSHLHLGLELVAQNQADYHLEHVGQIWPSNTSADTAYTNILITDGSYAGYSTDAQVQSVLEQMFAAGVTTHVIGFGELAQTPEALTELTAMADWGSGGELDHHAAATVDELEAALKQIAADLYSRVLAGNPCCGGVSCYGVCHPWTGCEGEGTGGDDDDPSGDGDGDTSDTGDGDGDGDGDPGDTGDGDGDSGETDAADTGGEETVDGPIVQDSDDSGCDCTTAPRHSRWLALFLLIGLAPRRRY